jgi:hypothetical protein
MHDKKMRAYACVSHPSFFKWCEWMLARPPTRRQSLRNTFGRGESSPIQFDRISFRTHTQMWRPLFRQLHRCPRLRHPQPRFGPNLVLKAIALPPLPSHLLGRQRPRWDPTTTTVATCCRTRKTVCVLCLRRTTPPRSAWMSCSTRTKSVLFTRVPSTSSPLQVSPLAASALAAGARACTLLHLP